MSSLSKLERRATSATFVLLCAVAAVACASNDKKSYPITYACSVFDVPGCPAQQPCPSISLGAGGCEDLPGRFGDAPIKVETGRPAGCIVGLPYGNPYYGDIQQTCICAQATSSTAQPNPLAWSCPK
jgi:hypothetical protein